MKLPSNIINNSFSEIVVNESTNGINIKYTLMLELGGEIAEGWKTGIALDASVSMMDAYGRGLEGTVPEDEKKKYQKKGWITTKTQDGKTVHYWKKAAYEDAIKQGYLKPSENIVQLETRKFSSYLAENLDQEAETDLIYWACGQKGDEISPIGIFNHQSCKTVEIKGPNLENYGKATSLLPALEYFEQKYNSAKRGLFIFLTDGAIDDLEKVKQYTINRLCKEIEKGKRNLLKAVIIGVGSEINENQMIELDDLDSGTEVDIWDHKIASEMKDLMEIFAELVDENKIVAPLGVIYDANGNAVMKYNDGVPARGEFELPSGSDFFVFEIGNQKIKQQIRI